MSLRSNPHFPVIVWLTSGCVLVLFMVLLGGATRLTQSGLSMVEWSPLGSLPPMNEADWQREFESYQTSPEYKILNKHFSVEDFKEIYWFEFIHRMTGRFIGIVFIIPFLWFLIRHRFPPGFLKKMLLLLLLGALQGVVGWLMVKSGLQKNPHVSHYRLAAHLLMALTLFGFIFWFMLDLIPGKEKSTRSSRWPMGLLLLLLLQIFYGALTAGLKAGYLYPTFPLMGDRLIPPLSVPGSGWEVILEGQVAVQFIHRLIAFTLLFLSMAFFYSVRHVDPRNPLRRGAQLFILGMGIQVLLGALTVWTTVHIVPAVAHQAMAFILTAILLWTLHRMQIQK
ncbi:MAG: COX15/CtaA family protein [Bacteroidia bacterium]|nr:COX15/CtaA family protein [Bacteroidia bacterium]